MKKIVSILALSIAINSHADTWPLTITNSSPSEITAILSVDGDYSFPLGDSPFTIASHTAQTISITGEFPFIDVFYGINNLFDSESLEETQYPFITVFPDYTAHYATEITEIPEPSAIAIFMIGVGFTLTWGLTAWGAGFVRAIVSGGNNE